MSRKCACGCGRPVEGLTAHGKVKRFLRGHIGRLNALQIYAHKLSRDANGNLLKRCTRCGESKPINAFSKSRTRLEHRRSHCKTCEREQARAHARKHPEPYRKRAARRRDRLRTLFIPFLNQLKAERGCAFCPEHTTDVLDFHHTKRGKPVYHASSYAALKRELAKCVIACANCHRKAHAGLVVVDPAKLLTDVEIPRLPTTIM